MDECLAPKQVATMLREAGQIAHVHGEPDTFVTGTPDVEWLPVVGARRWVVITKDKNIRKRQIELRLLHQSGVRAFVFTGSNMKGDEQALALKEALPAMMRAATSPRGELHRQSDGGIPRRTDRDSQVRTGDRRMKSPHHAELEEGPAAFERFRKAMKTIMSVKKNDVIDPPKTSRKKKPVNRRG